MATQVRYFDYGSRVRSKNSAEPLGLINGIGPVFGFNKVSLNPDSTKIIVGSNNKTSGNNHKSVYISDENGNLQIPDHLLINVDGIITTLYGDIELEKEESSMSEYMVIATHNYTPTSEVENPTIISLIPNNTEESFKDKINLDTTSINTWYDTIKTWDNSFNQSISVILAFIDLSDTSSIKVYNPYNNTWPLGSSNNVSSGISSVLEYNGKGDENIEIVSLNSLQVLGYIKGSRNTPYIYANIASYDNLDKNNRSIYLEILKLKQGMWSLKGTLKYKIGKGDADKAVKIIKADSSSEGKDDYNTILNYYTLSAIDLGFKIKNFKKLFSLNESDKLDILTKHSTVQLTNYRFGYGSKFVPKLEQEEQDSDLSIRGFVNMDPITSSYWVMNVTSMNSLDLEICFDITLKKQIAS